MIYTKEEAIKKLSNKNWRLNHLYKIITKDKRLITLKANKAQADYRKKRTKRDLILKARQLGFTTEKVIEYLDETIFNENTTTAIIAHRREKVQSIFEIVKLAFKYLPDLLKPRVSYDNKNELTFPDINSKIYVTMDTRSETVHNLHISEIDFMRNPQDILLAALESVPDSGTISIESTANGIGVLYDLWNDKDSEFKKHFYNWLWDKDYKIKTDKSFEELKREYKILAEEYELIEDAPDRFSMTKEQLAFYIKKIRRHKRKVVQEYPLTDREAFISSGKNVFLQSTLQKHNPIKPIEVRFGNEYIWEKPLKGFYYVIGVDTSEGLGKDNAVIEVFNAHTGFQALEFASNDIEPSELGKHVIRIGKEYNNALVVPEINGSGISTVDKIKLVYPNIYRREVLDSRTKELKKSIGWRTTGKTKPKLINDLAEAIREKDLIINSEELLKEMKTFVRTEESGKNGYGAEGGKKDDRVIATALALQGIKYIPSLKPPKTEAQLRFERYIEEKRLQELNPDQPLITSREQHRQFIRLRNRIE